MLLGLSSPLAHKTPKEWATRMKDLGCGAVVFPRNCRDSEASIDAYCNEAAKNGLVIAEVGVWNNVLSPDAAEREAAISYAIGQLKLADKIGARCCVNVAGTPKGPRRDGGYRENFLPETWEQTVKTIRRIIDSAEPTRTYFSIESMPWMIPTSPDEYLSLIRDVNRPRFRAHLDIVNMINCPERYFFNSEFITECFTKLKGMICSCHLKDISLLSEYTFRLEETACGKGTLDIETYAALATKEDESMPMIIEHLSSDSEYTESLLYVQNRLAHVADNRNDKKRCIEGI